MNKKTPARAATVGTDEIEDMQNSVISLRRFSPEKGMKKMANPLKSQATVASEHASSRPQSSDAYTFAERNEEAFAGSSSRPQLSPMLSPNFLQQSDDETDKKEDVNQKQSSYQGGKISVSNLNEQVYHTYEIKENME